jgi:beta-lactamase regulating signal transducer with metallopeptidase domain
VLRHDYLINLVQRMIETMLFYHPAVWWVSRQIRVERENCCDDIAVSVTRPVACPRKSPAQVVVERGLS